ncbi:hypothetical protein ACFWGI_06700 [Streptomyces niveus]|uniref:hypothetical protein n=1 Tax=Streptomyces niveus TaxID=193462 RepID=UPI003668657C
MSSSPDGAGTGAADGDRSGPRGAVVIERGRLRRLAPDGQPIESLCRKQALWRDGGACR